MGLLSKFEGKMEDTVEGAADRMGAAPLSPVQIAKKAEKQMRREKMVGAGKQYAPTLYTVLVNADDDRRLLGYYPTLAGETETYLSAKAAEQGLVMDGQPLVRFIVDDDLRHGKFDVIAEMVASPLVEQLRQEEYARYGIRPGGGPARAAAPQAGYGYQQPAPTPAPAPAPAGGYDYQAAPVDEYVEDDYYEDDEPAKLISMTSPTTAPSRCPARPRPSGASRRTTSSSPTSTSPVCTRKSARTSPAPGFSPTSVPPTAPSSTAARSNPPRCMTPTASS